MKRNVPTIGLMGGIGSGKSLIAEFLETLGCVVANADENASQVWKQQEVLDTIVSWWGDSVLLTDGSVNRSHVAKIVFQDVNERVRLESLLHPRIRALQENQFENANGDVVAYVIDAPLLMEAGLDTHCDALIFVDASPEIRHKRCSQTRNWDPKELERREAAQIPLDKKRDSADYVLCNEDTQSEAMNELRQILESILHKFNTDQHSDPD